MSIRGVASISYKGVRSSEDPCSAGTNSPIGMYHNDLGINFTDYFTTSHVTFTRGHSCKLFKPHAISRARANFFSVRIIDFWNNLPDFIIQAHSITVFKNLLDNHCSDLMYNYAS